MLSERAHTHALCSCNTPFLTQRIIDKIIDLNVKQQTIRNLSNRLTQALEKLPAVTRQVVHSYYRPYGATQNVAIQAHNLALAERTFYRHLDRATTYLAQHLTSLGINFFTWQDLLHSHAWIKETFMHQCQQYPQQKIVHQTAPNRQVVRPHPRTKPANQTVA